MRYSDPYGLYLILGGHIAADPFGYVTDPDSYHLAIYLDPGDCGCDNEFGKPVTIGGQKDGDKLVTAINYPGDSLDNMEHWQLMEPPKGMSECEYAKRILAAAKRYKNNQSYSFPSISILPWAKDGQMGTGQYNSNSYISGAITAAGGTPPALESNGQFQAPGYSNPLPIPSTR